MPKVYDDYYQQWDGFYTNNTVLKDILMFLVGATSLDYDDNTGITYTMNIPIASVHLHYLAKQMNSSSYCDFGAGPIERASYTRVDCGLARPRQIPDESHLAYPDTYDISSLAYAYTENFQARFTRESTSDSPITVITPQDLLRSYQVYTITKDTQYRQPISRTMSVKLSIVQLSTVFLVITVLLAVLIVLGIFKYLSFVRACHKGQMLAPESKLDWIFQSVHSEQRYGPISIALVDNRQSLSRNERKRAELKTARFGNSEMSPDGAVQRGQDQTAPQPPQPQFMKMEDELPNKTLVSTVNVAQDHGDGEMYSVEGRRG